MVYDADMEVLDKKLQKRVKTVSKKFGMNEREMINRAVLTYLSEIDDSVSLIEELRLWDILSAKTMRKYKF